MKLMQTFFFFLICKSVLLRMYKKYPTFILKIEALKDKIIRGKKNNYRHYLENIYVIS